MKYETAKNAGKAVWHGATSKEFLGPLGLVAGAWALTAFSGAPEYARFLHQGLIGYFGARAGIATYERIAGRELELYEKAVGAIGGAVALSLAYEFIWEGHGTLATTRITALPEVARNDTDYAGRASLGDAALSTVIGVTAAAAMPKVKKVINRIRASGKRK